MLVVFGAISVDMYLTVPHFPESRETVMTPTYHWLPGGKGMNHAVAAARAGAKVAMIGKVGNDGFGTRALNILKREGVLTSGIGIESDMPTGCSTVLLGREGEKRIITASGANVSVEPEQIPSEILNNKNIILFQMELPVEKNLDVLMRAAKGGATTILNLAPVNTLPKEALEHVDYLIVNRNEAELIAAKLGLNVEKDAMKLAHVIARQFDLTCIITLSAQGAVCVEGSANQGYVVPTLHIDQMVDRTGSGDCFCGVLAACLHKGYSLPEALRLASVAGALSVRALGAQTAMPLIDDILHYLPSLPQVQVVAF